jgi:hypothetical protein
MKRIPQAILIARVIRLAGVGLELRHLHFMSGGDFHENPVLPSNGRSAEKSAG